MSSEWSLGFRRSDKRRQLLGHEVSGVEEDRSGDVFWGDFGYWERRKVRGDGQWESGNVWRRRFALCFALFSKIMGDFPKWNTTLITRPRVSLSDSGDPSQDGHGTRRNTEIIHGRQKYMRHSQLLFH